MKLSEVKEINESSNIIDVKNFKEAMRRKSIADSMGMNMDEIRAFSKGFLDCYEQMKPVIEALEKIKNMDCYCHANWMAKGALKQIEDMEKLQKKMS